MELLHGSAKKVFFAKLKGREIYVEYPTTLRSFFGKISRTNLNGDAHIQIGEMSVLISKA